MKSILVVLFVIVIGFFLICNEGLGIGEKIGISCGGLCDISESVESLGVSCSTRNGTTPEEKITNNFESYQSYANKGDTKAMKYITADSITYFDELIAKIKYSREGDIKKDNPVAQMIILRTRKSISGNDLEHMTGEELLYQLIKNKDIEYLTFKGDMISNIKIIDSKAEVAVRINGESTSTMLEFRKIDDKWELNLISLLEIEGELIKKEAAKNNISATEYVFNKVKSEFDSVNNSVYEQLFIK